MSEHSNTGAVILAAGESSRMNFPKPIMKFDDRMRFIDKIVHEFEKFGCDKIVIVINKELTDDIVSNGKICVVVNEHPEVGRFSSIIKGIKEIEDMNYCFVHNCDNPYVSPDVLQILINNKSETGYVFPVFKKRGGHPILISKTIINAINEEQDGTQNFRNFLKNFESHSVEINDEMILVNINTQEDFRKYIKG